ALRQIECIARDQEGVGLGCERPLEDRRIVLVLSWVPAASASGAGIDGNSRRGCAREIARGQLEVFMQHALEAEALMVAEDLWAEMRYGAMANLNVVEIMRQRRFERLRIEAGVQNQQVVGIDDHRVVDVLDFAQPLQ